MAALRIRTPTLQTLLTARPLPRSTIIPRGTLHKQPFNTPFSTTRIARNTSAGANGSTNANGNPSYPKFSLKSIVPNPRMRKAIIAGLVVMAGVEGYMWVRYWPQIMGWVGYGGEGKEGKE